MADRTLPPDFNNPLLIAQRGGSGATGEGFVGGVRSVVGGAVGNLVGGSGALEFIADLAGNVVIAAAGVGLVVFGVRRMFGG